MDLAAPLTAVLWLGAGLLVYAGASKVPTPDGAMAALHSLHLPSGRVAARVLGLGEVALGIGVVVVGGRPAAVAAALTWTAMTAVAARQRAAQVDCGCFGVRRYPVSRLHVGVNALLAVAALAALARPPLALTEVHADAGTLVVLAGLLLVATGVGLLTALTERAGMAEAARL